jgi:hypothetical protein
MHTAHEFNPRSGMNEQHQARSSWRLAGAAAMLAALAGCNQRSESADRDSPTAARATVVQAASPEPEPPPAADIEIFNSHVRPFFAKHCAHCHGADLAEAKLRLDTLAADFLNRPAADHWVEVLDRLNLGEMPPEDEPRPDDADLVKVTDWITSELRLVRERSQSTGGRTLLRRLTRREYANTVRDLLNVEFVEGEGPLELLQPDGSMAGFDRISKALLVDPSLMDAYLAAAQDAADRAIVFRPPLVSQRTLRFEFERTPDTAMKYLLYGRAAELDGGVLVIMDGGARTFAKLRHPFNDKEIPTTGKYRIRVRAGADPGVRGEPVYMDVSYGSAGRQARFRVDAPKDALEVYEFESTFDAATPGEFQVYIVNGARFSQGNAEWHQRNGDLTQLAEDGNLFAALRIKARMRAEGAYDDYVRSSLLPGVLHTEGVPKLYLDWIELIGPLQGEYPPPSMTTIFGSQEVAARFATSATPREQLLQGAREVFANLLPRAFRRPVQDSEVDAIVKLIGAELEAGAEPQQAIKTGVIAMLCSPDFLFLFEPAPDGTPRLLNDHELATRLSYFLWSTMPDEELTRLAAADRLHDPEVLTAQVDRMLADAKIEGFIDSFARQWLKTEEFGRFPPDEQIYPRYYATEMAGIEEDVKQEPLAFFREVLLNDEPVTSFLDSDWLMLNDRLAKLYALPGVSGPELRRVALERSASDSEAARRRGGLLGMAGVHLWGADGNRTKPVERGKYILTVLFNDPPPPPPPNAGEVEPNVRGERLTVRERLARHREQTTCNHCHRRIDPYGLAMENFNVIGQWRDQMDGEKPLAHWGENRPAIDASGTLPNGRDFGDFISFKQALREQHERLVRALAEKLFVYALGRTIEPGDRPTIDRVVAAAQESDLSMRRMLRSIVASEAFLAK